MYEPLNSGRIRKLDRAALVISIGGLVLVCWWYLFQMAQHMSDMSMPMRADHEIRQAWGASDFLSMLIMWVVMMIAMMVPTAVRTLFIFERICLLRSTGGSVAGQLFGFVGGYVLAWALFSVGATVVQWWLHDTAKLSDQMALSSPGAGALVLIAAGLWQLSRLKDVCLRHCRSPIAFLLQHYRQGWGGAIRLGGLHGLYCLGCCWVLMGLLFVAGVMNLVWIIILTGFVLAEKLVPHGLVVSRLIGLGMIALGVILPLLPE